MASLVLLGTRRTYSIVEAKQLVTNPQKWSNLVIIELSLVRGLLGIQSQRKSTVQTSTKARSWKKMLRWQPRRTPLYIWAHMVKMPSRLEPLPNISMTVRRLPLFNRRSSVDPIPMLGKSNFHQGKTKQKAHHSARPLMAKLFWQPRANPYLQLEIYSQAQGSSSSSFCVRSITSCVFQCMKTSDGTVG